MLTQVLLRPDHVNPLARVLFTAKGAENEPRRYLRREELATIDGVTFSFNGEELGLDDLAVYLQILQLKPEHEQGGSIQVSVSPYALLRAVGNSREEKNYDLLRASVERLVSGTLTFTMDQGRSGYADSLIQSMSENRATPEWTLRFSKAMLEFFAPFVPAQGET